MPRPSFKQPKRLPVPKVAVLVDTSTTWGRSIVRGINSYRLEHGPWEIFIESRGLEERLRPPQGWQGHGIIARISSDRMAREIKARKIPAINVSSIKLTSPAFPRVTTDIKASARLAAKHFLERGFRHFAYFSLRGLRYVGEHLESFRKAVVGPGRTFASMSAKPAAGAELDWGYDLKLLGDWLASLPKPLAVLCWNDSVAREIIFACHERGISIPEEIAVLSASHDETLCETSLVSISGVVAAAEQIGKKAAELLDVLMRGGRVKPDHATLIPPTGIITRKSTDILAIRDPALVKALSFIRSKAGQAVPVNAVASHAGVSRRVLERRFHELLRRSPASEIRRVNLEQAKRLLLDTSLSVGQVAEAAGFSSHIYFSAIFRRQIGISPLAYRNNNRLTKAGNA